MRVHQLQAAILTLLCPSSHCLSVSEPNMTDIKHVLPKITTNIFEGFILEMKQKHKSKSDCGQEKLGVKLFLVAVLLFLRSLSRVVPPPHSVFRIKQM